MVTPNGGLTMAPGNPHPDPLLKGEGEDGRANGNSNDNSRGVPPQCGGL